MAEQVLGDGLSAELFAELRDRAPDPLGFAAAVDDLVPRATGVGRFGLADLALTLAVGDGRFREPAEAAVRDSGLSRVLLTRLCATGATASGDALLWWHTVFLDGIGLDSAHDTLLQQHAGFLLQHRRDAVLAHLLEPDRGPGDYLCSSFTHVLCALGDCPPLEERWADWIRRGGFETARPASETSRVLAGRLTALSARGVPAGRRLLAETTARWCTLLADGDAVDRRRVVRALWSMLLGGPLFADQVVLGDDVLGAVLRDVAPAVDRAGLAEAAAVRLALTAARWVLRDRTPAADRYAQSAESRLHDVMAVEEQRTPGLPWPAATALG